MYTLLQSSNHFDCSFALIKCGLKKIFLCALRELDTVLSSFFFNLALSFNKIFNEYGLLFYSFNPEPCVVAFALQLKDNTCHSKNQFYEIVKRKREMSTSNNKDPGLVNTPPFLHHPYATPHHQLFQFTQM